ncbi:riboflavin synthase [Streptomyces winkii]|uniref:riboflavin synthase n=1 Tax=Streptomyces winkii TaxID=3051178 RepID=UPI0028D601ED|nr:riboflavin synthase [Streptomyces sp. DSM 40971]
MFTGIVEELGEVVAVEKLPGAARLRLRGPLVTEGAGHGDSIAVNGVCLTVVETSGGEFTADVIGETLARSSLGALAAGSRVNLERPMALGGRLDGHIVQGHVDGTGTVAERTEDGTVRIQLPPQLAKYIVEKGSITVDGVSLTVVEAGDAHFTVGLIPTTLELTTLGIKGPGDPVNLEVDVLAKYVERLLTHDRGTQAGGSEPAADGGAADPREAVR